MGKGYSSARKIEKLIASAEIDIRDRSKYVPGSISYPQLQQMDRRFNDTIQELRDIGYDTEGLERRYDVSIQDFIQQRDEKSKNYNWGIKEGRRRTVSLGEKIGLVALATVLGSGLYANSLFTHTEDQNLKIMGGTLLTAGVIGGIGLAYKLRKIFRERNKPK